MLLLRLSIPTVHPGCCSQGFPRVLACLVLACVCYVRGLGELLSHPVSQHYLLLVPRSRHWPMTVFSLLLPYVLSSFIPTIGLHCPGCGWQPCFFSNWPMTHTSTRLSKEDGLLSRGSRADGMHHFRTECAMPDSVRGPALMGSSGRWTERPGSGHLLLYFT